MKKRWAVLLVFYIFAATTITAAVSGDKNYTQQKKTTSANAAGQPTEFEKKIDEFRYSLYHEIDNIPDSCLVRDSFWRTTQLKAKCQQFLDENAVEIRRYKESVIRIHADKPIPDLGDYTWMDEEFIGDMNEYIKLMYSAEFGEYTDGPPMSYWNVITINPISRAYMHINMINSQLGGAIMLGSESIRNMIGTPRISAIRSSDGVWHIYIDFHKYIYSFGYEPDSDMLLLEEMYSRNIDEPYDDVEDEDGFDDVEVVGISVYEPDQEFFVEDGGIEDASLIREIGILGGAAVLEMDCRYIDFPCIGIQFADSNVKMRMGTYLEVKRDGDSYLVKVKYDAERFDTIDKGIEAYLKELFRDFYKDGHKKYGAKVWKAFIKEGGLKLFIDTAKEHIDDEFLDSPFNEIYG